MEYTYKLESGRIGTTLDVFLSDGGSLEKHYTVRLNAKGFFVQNVVKDPTATDLDKTHEIICDFDSFEYPDDIQEEEIDFLNVINGPFTEEIKRLLRMCSMLCAQWAAGHSEERMHESIRSSLASWNS